MDGDRLLMTFEPLDPAVTVLSRLFTPRFLSYIEQ